jgi:hypothetical protein
VTIGKWATLGTIALLVLIVASLWIGASNSEARLRNQFGAKQTDNTSQFDNMWKKIAQSAQVTEKDRESLAEIFVQHAQARTGSGEGGAVMKWIQESVPNISSDTFRNLQNIIVASRDSWTDNQRQLLDIKREHDNLLDTFPSSIFVGGRARLKATIVTSERTDEAFKSGRDENTAVFGK